MTDQPMITADSQPDYDAWGWDTWGCPEWITWHQKLKQRHGLVKANQVWLQAWSKQGSWEHAFNWCKYNSSFTSYFKKQGIETGHLLSKVLVSAENVVENVADSVDHLSKGVVNVSKTLKTIAPLALGTVILGLGYYGYKHYIKGNSKIKIPILSR